MVHGPCSGLAQEGADSAVEAMAPLEHPSNMPHQVKLREDQAAQEAPLAKVALVAKEHLVQKVVRMSPEAAHRTQDDLLLQALTA